MTAQSDTISFNICIPKEQDPVKQKPFHEWDFPDGTPWGVFYRANGGYFLRFQALADFTISTDGLEVTAVPVPGVTRQTIEHLYLNQVQALALSRQGKFVLHASAVEIMDFAVAFLGVSGRGKSTLAASFATAGHRFLTDDGMQLEKTDGGYAVMPSHPSIRLWEDSSLALMPETASTAPPIDYTPKARFLADDVVAFCATPRPLRAVYFLGDGKVDRVSIVPISGRDAMMELVKNNFLLDIEARDMLVNHFSQLSEMVLKPMFFQLDYPRRYEVLPVARDAVVHHAVNLIPTEGLRDVG